MIRLLREDLWFTSCDRELCFRDLKDLGVVQFAIVGAVAKCLDRWFRQLSVLLPCWFGAGEHAV
jgi:hypothetical protein